jgi:ABC-type Fe3+/spermidine/putrescine transport system ATPase subunit
MTEFDVVLEHAYKTFPGGVRAVIDFNAELKHGEFVALLGPSGCGKTTILRMIGGLEEATEGKIFIAGRDVTDLPPAHRDTSMMFQSFALFPHRTVFQNVEFSLKMKGMEKSARDRRVWEMLEMVGLASFASLRPRDLSGGQQQRVALARALISRPTVLLLDEPLGSLDFNLRQAMMIELKKLQRELNITFVMVTHSQQEALSLADKVIVMSDAVIQQIDTSRERCTRIRGRNSWRSSSETTICSRAESARVAAQSCSSNRSVNCCTSRFRQASNTCRSATTCGSRSART